MLVGYTRVSTADGAQVLDLQRNVPPGASAGPDRLGRDLRHLVNPVYDPVERDAGPKVTM